MNGEEMTQTERELLDPTSPEVIRVPTPQGVLIFTRWKEFSTLFSLDKGAEISIPNTRSTLRIQPRYRRAAVWTAFKSFFTALKSMSVTVFTFDAKKSHGVQDDEFVSDLIKLSLPPGLSDDDVRIEMCHEHGLALDPMTPTTSASKVVFYYQPHTLARTEHPIKFGQKIAFDGAGKQKFEALLQSFVVKVVVSPSAPAAVAVTSLDDDVGLSFFTHFYGLGRHASSFRALSFEKIKIPDGWRFDLCIISTRPEHRDRYLAYRNDGRSQPLLLDRRIDNLFLSPTESNVVKVDDIEGWINKSRRKMYFINMQQLLAARDSPIDAWVDTFDFAYNHRELLQRLPTMSANVTIISGDRRQCLRIQCSASFSYVGDHAEGTSKLPDVSSVMRNQWRVVARFIVPYLTDFEIKEIESEEEEDQPLCFLESCIKKHGLKATREALCSALLFSDLGSGAREVFSEIYAKMNEEALLEPVLQIERSELVYDEDTDFLAGGSTGDVYKATLKKGNVKRQVAVKHFCHYSKHRRTEKEYEMFKVEASILLRIEPNDNVLSLIGLCAVPRYYALVTEFASGGGLHSLLKSAEHKELVEKWQSRVAFAKQIAQGMLHLHYNHPSVIHNDLRAQNVLINILPNLIVPFLCKVADFGLSEMAGDNSVTTVQPGTWPAGTVTHIAPERYRDRPYGDGDDPSKMDLARKADVYSYGVVMWEIRERQSPYRGMKEDSIRRHVMGGGELPKGQATGVPPFYDHLMEKSLLYNPQKRPTFREIVAAHTTPVDDLPLPTPKRVENLITVVTALRVFIFSRWKKFSSSVSLAKGAEISIPNTSSALRIQPREGCTTIPTTSICLTVFTFDAKQSQGVRNDEYVSDLILLSLPSGLTEDDVHIEMCQEHGLSLDPTAPAASASKGVFFYQPHDPSARTEHPIIFDEKIVVDKAGERKIASVLQSSVVKVTVFPSTGAAAVSSSNSDATVSFFTHFYGVGSQAFLFRALSFEKIKLPDAWKIDLCIISTRPEHRDRLIANRSDGLHQPLLLLDKCISLLLWPKETNVVEVGDIEGWSNKSLRKKVLINMQQLLEARDSPIDAWVETFSFVCNYRELLQQVSTVTANVTIRSGDRRHCLRIEDSSSNFQKIFDKALQRGFVSINRSRVIVVGQDGAGKSCLVDSLLNRPFESGKASTEGAAVTMSHTAASGWKATDNKEYLDPLIAEGCQQTALTANASKPISSAEVKKPRSQPIDAPKAHHRASRVKTKSERRADVVCIEAKMLTPKQQVLVADFLADKPSESDLRERTISVRDIWDLGGQEVYLATHSALMPNSSTFDLTIYMVVMDISKSLSDVAESFYRSTDGQVINLSSDLGWMRRNEDFPLYWFGSIAACHEETVRGDYWLGEDEEVKPPPVFAIGSHRDVLENDKKRFPDSATVGKWLSQQGQRLEELLSDSDFVMHIVRPKRSEDKKVDEDFHEISHFVERIFLIDNSVSGLRSPCRGVEEVRRRVDRMASTYCKRMQKQPLFWVYLERLLFHWQKSMKIIAGVDEIAEIAKKPNICDISSRDEVLAALKFLANVGAILYYPEVDGLKDIVFTSPTWVIKALSAFVAAAQPGPKLEPEWNKLKKTGIMSSELMKYRLKQMRQEANSRSDVAGFFEDDNLEGIENEEKLVVRLLQLLDVIAPLAESSAKEFYVPSMLRKSFFYSTTFWEEHTYSSLFPAPLIVIPKKQKFVPECLYFRLVTRFLKLYSEKPRLSRHQCIFLADDEESPVRVEVELLYQSRGKWIALTIRFINKEDENNMSAAFLASIKNEFLRQMKSICHQGMRGFKYSICCQIRIAVNSGNECGIDLSSLPVIYSDEDEYCPNLPRLCNPFDEPLATNPDDLFQINFWFGQLPHQLCPIVQNVPSVSQINDLAYEIRERWTQVAYRLKPEPFSHSDVECIKYKSPRDLRNQSQSMLDAWMSKFGSKATIPVLCEALIKAELRNQAERVFTKSVVDKCVSSLP